MDIAMTMLNWLTVRSTRLILLIFLEAINIPCYGQSNELQNEIAAYNKNDFQGAVNIGTNIILQDPDNETARYYLANAYSYLNQISEARQQYAFCAQYAKSPQIKAYAEEALRQVNSLINDRFKTPLSYQRNETSYPYAGPGDAELQRSNSFKYLREDSNNAMKVARREERDQLDTSSGDSVKGDTHSKIRQIRRNESEKRKQIKQIYQQRMQGLGSTILNPYSQFQSGSSNIQLSPVGLNMYVKNYVIYNTDNTPAPPVVPELHATEQKLDLRKVSPSSAKIIQK